MKRRNIMLNHIARILILISIATFSFGLILDINNDKRLIDPVKGVINTTNDKNTISITPADTNKVTTNPENTEEETPVENTINNNISEKPLIEVNQELRDNLQKKFGITIKYGKETDGYTVGGLSTVSMTNEKIINIQLNKLSETLNLYPEGFFKEINDGGIPLTIYLIEKYSDENITGITDSSYSYANISISAIFPFEESFYHESYHYIERYLFKEGANYNSWDILNPQGFVYNETIFNDYSYSNTYLATVPFVNNYAQTAAAEDRASTFEYMMAKDKASCLNQGNTIWKKAQLLANTIDVVFNTVNPDTTEYWERYIEG